MDFKRYVINLESRPDRRQEIDAELHRIGWEAEFIKAIRPNDTGGFPSVGARGCFESHLTVLRMARGSDLILMEDDLNFVPQFPEKWQSALGHLPHDWSIFYPAYDLTVSGLIQPDEAVKGAHMVVFRTSVIDRIITELENIMSRPPGHALGGPMHVDGAYSTIRSRHPDINTYGVYPRLGYQRRSISDISPAHWLDAYPTLAIAARKARDFLSPR